MRRALLIFALLAAVAVLVVVLGPSSSDENGYLVRGYFDNGGFVVKGEQVRVAGANVGSVDAVNVSMPGEEVHADGKDDPGKAVVVMKITDPAFEDFLSDSSCIIRPQSLLGEKFVDCKPTEPRAPGVKPPPQLKKIPDGQPGAGERFLPLENNGKQVDLDIVQNINRLPYAQRFRLILNDLGAGLAARGEDLNAIIRRADPALRETDQVLQILAEQHRTLANLATDSETVLGPLARERTHLAGFIDNAAISGTATAERRGDLEAGLQKFPAFLAELRSTMVRLRSFSEQAQPVASNLNAAAPALTKLTRLLVPFSKAGEVSLTSLGDATAKSTDPLVQSDSVVKQLTKLSETAASPSKNLNKLLASLRKTNGYQGLLDFIYNTSGVANGFDQFGHFLRSELIVTPCVDYVTAPTTGCGAQFTSQKAKVARSLQLQRLAHRAARNAQRHSQQEATPGNGAATPAGSKALLNFLLGSGTGVPGGAPSGAAAGSTPQATPGSAGDQAQPPANGSAADPRGIGK